MYSNVYMVMCVYQRASVYKRKCHKTYHQTVLVNTHTAARSSSSFVYMGHSSPLFRCMLACFVVQCVGFFTHVVALGDSIAKAQNAETGSGPYGCLYLLPSYLMYRRDPSRGIGRSLERYKHLVGIDKHTVSECKQMTMNATNRRAFKLQLDTVTSITEWMNCKTLLDESDETPLITTENTIDLASVGAMIEGNLYSQTSDAVKWIQGKEEEYNHQSTFATAIKPKYLVIVSLGANDVITYTTADKRQDECEPNYDNANTENGDKDSYCMTTEDAITRNVNEFTERLLGPSLSADIYIVWIPPPLLNSYGKLASVVEPRYPARFAGDTCQMFLSASGAAKVYTANYQDDERLKQAFDAVESRLTFIRNRIIDQEAKYRNSDGVERLMFVRGTDMIEYEASEGSDELIGCDCFHPSHNLLHALASVAWFGINCTESNKPALPPGAKCRKDSKPTPGLYDWVYRLLNKNATLTNTSHYIGGRTQENEQGQEDELASSWWDRFILWWKSI